VRSGTLVLARISQMRLKSANDAPHAVDHFRRVTFDMFFQQVPDTARVA
jgi:hypothetical protein